jgi:hypothetical protein
LSQSPLRRDDGVSILENEEGKDQELNSSIVQLGVAEYQVNKLHHFLAGKLDRSNPVAFSKGSSTFTFESGGREYKITINVDTFKTKDKSITRSMRNAIQSPAFIITSTLCSAIVCILAIVSSYWGSPILGTLSDSELEMLENQYFLMLDRCALLMNDDRPNPRTFGPLYATCNKAIVQLEEICNNYQIAVCEDERVELYLTGNRPRL